VQDIETSGSGKTSSRTSRGARYLWRNDTVTSLLTALEQSTSWSCIEGLCTCWMVP